MCSLICKFFNLHMQRHVCTIFLLELYFIRSVAFYHHTTSNNNTFNTFAVFYTASAFCICEENLRTVILHRLGSYLN
jgi:hypothetical protein